MACELEEFLEATGGWPGTTCAWACEDGLLDDPTLERFGALRVNALGELSGELSGVVFCDVLALDVYRLLNSQEDKLRFKN